MFQRFWWFTLRESTVAPDNSLCIDVPTGGYIMLMKRKWNLIQKRWSSHRDVFRFWMQSYIHHIGVDDGAVLWAADLAGQRQTWNGANDALPTRLSGHWGWHRSKLVMGNGYTDLPRSTASNLALGLPHNIRLSLIIQFPTWTFSSEIRSHHLEIASDMAENSQGQNLWFVDVSVFYSHLRVYLSGNANCNADPPVTSYLEHGPTNDFWRYTHVYTFW